MKIYKQFTFEAAHRLPNVPEGHKCARLHDRSFHVEIHVGGPIGADQLGRGFRRPEDRLRAAPPCPRPQLPQRHSRPRNPTSENIARWIWDRLSPTLPNLSQIVIRETCTNGSIYAGR